MKYYTIGEFAKLVGLKPQTLRVWDKQGKLKPHHVLPNRHRYYTLEQAEQLLGVKLEDLRDAE